MEWATDFILGISKGLGYLLAFVLFTMLLNKAIGSLKQERQDKALTWMDKVVQEIKKFEKAFWENRYLLFWIFLIVVFSLNTYK